MRHLAVEHIRGEFHEGCPFPTLAAQEWGTRLPGAPGLLAPMFNRDHAAMM